MARPVIQMQNEVIEIQTDQLVTEHIPPYEADEGALTKTQINKINKIKASALKIQDGIVRSTLF